jgi:hypothetical protein
MGPIPVLCNCLTSPQTVCHSPGEFLDVELLCTFAISLVFGISFRTVQPARHQHVSDG